MFGRNLLLGPSGMNTFYVIFRNWFFSTWLPSELVGDDHNDRCDEYPLNVCEGLKTFLYHIVNKFQESGDSAVQKLDKLLADLLGSMWTW